MKKGYTYLEETLDGKLYHNVCHVHVISEIVIEVADGFRDNK